MPLIAREEWHWFMCLVTLLLLLCIQRTTRQVSPVKLDLLDAFSLFRRALVGRCFGRILTPGSFAASAFPSPPKKWPSHSPTDMRRYAIRATQKCLLTNAFALLLLPFAASRFSQVLWSERESW